MKKKVLLSLALLTMVVASQVFAQQATPDKLRFIEEKTQGGGYIVQAASNKISGAVVIPETHLGKAVISVNHFVNCTGIISVSIPNSVTRIGLMTFSGCTSLTSITIPASVTHIGANAFNGCTKLSSVTFQKSGISFDSNSTNAFPGDLVAKYKAGGAGTYKRQGDPAKPTWVKDK